MAALLPVEVAWPSGSPVILNVIIMEFDIHEIYGRTRCAMNEGVIIRNRDKGVEIRLHCDDNPGIVNILLRFAQFLFPEEKPVTSGDHAIKNMYH